MQNENRADKNVMDTAENNKLPEERSKDITLALLEKA